MSTMSAGKLGAWAAWIILTVNAGMAATLYVASGGGNSSPYASWTDAATDLKAAVDKANSYTNGSTVWVSNEVFLLTSPVVISNTIVRGYGGNRAVVVVNGGGTIRPFYLNHANAVLADLTVSNGYATGAVLMGHGGGVYENGGLISNCIVTGCSATNNAGGIFQNSGIVRDCLITGNSALGTAIGTAGGLYMAGSRLAFGCTVSNNQAWGATSGGGGVSMSTSAIISNSTIACNSGVAAGGVYTRSDSDTPCIISHCTIEGNLASNAVAGAAGGIMATKKTQIVRNCLIRRNIAYSSNAAGGGGGVVGGPSPFIMEACTVVSNEFRRIGGAGTGGGGVFNNAGSNYWSGCILYNNKSASGVAFDSFYIVNFDGSTNTIFNSCVERPWKALPPSQGNITNNPLFVAAASDNYRLQGGSPCINTGTNLAWMTGASDLDGNPRLDAALQLVDMGCYEVLPSSGTVFTLR